jgi:hypothetical protein
LTGNSFSTLRCAVARSTDRPRSDIIFFTASAYQTGLPRQIQLGACQLENGKATGNDACTLTAFPPTTLC